jgi:hypothetical protein
MAEATFGIVLLRTTRRNSVKSHLSAVILLCLRGRLHRSRSTRLLRFSRFRIGYWRGDSDLRVYKLNRKGLTHVTNHRSLLITASLLLAAAFVGFGVQSGTAANTAPTLNVHPQQMASPTPSPMGT